MAEFKLGRIKFVWQGDWVAAKAYVKDDIVRYGGQVYICVTAHTSGSDFYLDSVNWNTMSDGQQWKGDWAISTYYKVGDVVKYGGLLYVANNGHTSAGTVALGLEQNQGDWDLYAENTDWKGDWSVNTRYKKNDLVKYGGNIYLCNTYHTSSTTVVTDIDGLEADLSKWDIYSKGFDWKGAWLPSNVTNGDVRYKPNDLVLYGGQVMVCIVGHKAESETNGLEADSSKWEYFHKGVVYKTDWATNVRYKVNDVVKYGANLWICTTEHTSTSSLAADENATGIIATVNNISAADALRTAGTYNDVPATSTGSGTGQRFKIVIDGSGAATSVTPLRGGQGHSVSDTLTVAVGNIGGTGSGITFSVATVSTGKNWEVFVPGLEFEDSWNIQSQYQPGDIVTYGGYSYVATTNNIGKAPYSNQNDWDLYLKGFNHRGDWGEDSTTQDYYVGDVVRVGGYTYMCIQDHAGTAIKPPNTSYWERLNSGFEWNGDWTNLTDYDTGDVVYYGVNSYVVVQTHQSNQSVGGKRPDLDVSGTYYKILAGGNESSALTTDGDLLYYSGSGPTRLPIGVEGQILTVSDTGMPEWRTWGSTTHVYYVGPNGTDGTYPKYGATVDRPFASVRHACKMIEDGPLYPNAKWLLMANRQFIQEQVVEYIDYNVTNSVSPFVGFTYPVDKADFKKRVGWVVDRITKDMSAGGNKETRNLTLEYYDDFGTGATATASANALNYIKTLVDAIISNLAPSQNYATLNSVGSPIPQTIDATYSEETGAQAKLESLVNILTTQVASADSSLDGLPAQEIVQKTVFVKTGIYYEVLPIIVPEHTAVVGDELRSTNIRPATAAMFTQSSDTNYTLAGYERLQAIVSDVIQGNSIVKTPSNTQTQVTNNATGSATEGTFVANQIQAIQDYIDYWVNNNTQDSTPPEVNPYASSLVPSYDDNVYGAITMLHLNKDFLAEEVTAYIDTTYPAYTYTQSKCQRDVKYFIEGFIWELIHGGNYYTLLNARYYANSVNGSLTEDMFYMRNGTGLRNCTVQGLTGTLSAANDYGTKRPTAGAFVSLDPGWGPEDPRVWIQTRSPYVQNVTTFGTGCVGMKVDGDLHNGGNDSIVANDFTQVLDQGIGAWITNLGRAELVSVFSYYGHIGYLAENGGKIRATNGNSSYGDFGTVAEGVDPSENAVTGTVNNRYQEAQIKNVITDQNEILALEYSNAGNNYTNSTYTFGGDGVNAVAIGDEFRDQAVFQIRMLNLDVNADGEGNFGGADYGFVNNTAQSGDATQIVISNTDTANTGDYNGMRIFITSGLGVGQYGYIGTYGAGSKTATVFKESDGTAGWDHIIPGTAISSLLDGTTKYEIEPRVTIPHPGFADSSVNIGPNLQINRFAAGYNNGRLFVMGNNVNTIVKSTDGSTWSAAGNLTAGGPWQSIAGDGGDNLVAITNTGTSHNYSNDNGDTWSAVTFPAGGNWVKTVYGNGRWVVISLGTAGMYSTDGQTWTQTTLPATAGGNYVDMVFGRGEFVALSEDGQIARSVDGITWNTVGLTTLNTYAGGGGADYSSIAYGRGRFIVLTDSGRQFWSMNISSWSENTSFPLAGNRGNDYGPFIAYGMGEFVATQGAQGGAGSVTITGGGTDALRPEATYYISPSSYTGGGTNPNGTGTGLGVKVEISDVGAATVTIVNPGRWYDGTEVFTIADSDIGNAGGTDLTFTVGSLGTGQEMATSPDGITWTSRTGTGLGSVSRFQNIIFGNPSNTPTWYRIQTSTTSQNRILTGCKPFIRARVATGKIADMKILEPGSGYATVPTLTITDPSNTVEAPVEVRVGNGALGNPTISNRGIGYETANATVTGDGYQDTYQPGSQIFVEGLTASPKAGSNVTFSGITNITYTNAYELLTTNKEYLKDEVIAWIEAQITAGTGIWSGFTYDATKCERDTGYIVDALAFDLKYGGNTETIKASKLYWDGATSQVAGQQQQTVASINELRDIINNYILTNTAHSSLQSPVVTTQTILGNDGETGTVSKVTYLTGIMTNVITNGLSVVPATKGLNDPYFKLVTVRELLGSGPFTARLQLSPDVPVDNAPEHGDAVELRIRYSQVRLTGHDFLDVGTGGLATTNYPGIPTIEPDATKETYQAGGGRVFYTSTDQDGNFRVGELFSVEQSTGVATLDADAFNIAGLNELSLGSVELGGTGATITEFSTDGTFAANSDSVVPTQRAIRTYINSQIGGGNSELNVNIMTAGVVEIKEDQISTTTGVEIKVKAKVNFLGGVDGDIVALQRYLLS